MNLKAKLASQSALIFGVRLFGAALVFLAQAAIARAWGSATLGDYLIIMAAVNLIAMVMPLGFQTVGTYFAAEYRALAQRRLAWRFALRAYAHILIMAVLIFGVGAPIVAQFGAAGAVLAAHWMPVAMLASATAVIFTNGAFLVGLKRPFAGFFADALFRPMLLIAGFLIAVVLGNGEIDTLLWSFAAGYVLVAIGHFAITVRSLRAIGQNDEPTTALNEAKRWWRFAMPWVLISLATDFFFDIDLIALAGHLGREDLAVFGVCARIFALVSFGVAAVYAVTLPDIFEAEAKSDRSEFMRRIGDANLVAAGLSVGLFALVGVLGPFALLLFGPQFLVGAGPLAVLCLGLAVRSVFGPASLVLSIHDRPYASLPAVGVGVASLLGANLVLVPMFGLMGAALAALFAITIWSGGLWLTAKTVAGLDVSIVPRLTSWLAERKVAANAQ